jgi:AraC family transcriptional regulator, regulatory protein of adaptative response / methylated-DNA-[protein]-cysteine methyltransferase
LAGDFVDFGSQEGPMHDHTSASQDGAAAGCRALLDGLGAAARHDAADRISVGSFDTPIGPLIAIAGRAGLHMLEFVDGRGVRPAIDRVLRRLDARVDDRHDPLLAQAAAQIAEYFAGRRRVFGVALAALGTERQKRAWHYLSSVPFGETRSYTEMAVALGNAKAVRAAGSANGANPLSIVVPCHRIVGTDGSLTGYGGGLERKRWLLDHEKRFAAAPSGSPPVDGPGGAPPTAARPPEATQTGGCR